MAAVSQCHILSGLATSPSTADTQTSRQTWQNYGGNTARLLLLLLLCRQVELWSSCQHLVFSCAGQVLFGKQFFQRHGLEDVQKAFLTFEENFEVWREAQVFCNTNATLELYLCKFGTDDCIKEACSYCFVCELMVDTCLTPSSSCTTRVWQCYMQPPELSNKHTWLRAATLSTS